MISNKTLNELLDILDITLDEIKYDDENFKESELYKLVSPLFVYVEKLARDRNIIKKD